MQSKSRFRMGRGNLWIVAVSGVLLWAILAGAQVAAALQDLTLEPEATLLPGGPGKKPFDVTRHTIPLTEIEIGGPPRDGIPAISRPEFIEADRAGDFLKGDDRVLGVFLKDEAKAYPVRVLNYHELVNDTVGGHPILVSWCPLCGSGVVYDSVVQGQRRWFGVSGRLYKRNLLFYDRETDSLWSQLLAQAVTGPLVGTVLKLLPAENTTWSAWKAEHPQTLLLSAPASGLNYKEDPYATYPLRRGPALLVSAGGQRKIYPFAELKKQLNENPAGLTDKVGGRTITIIYEGRFSSVHIRTPGSSAVVFFEGFLDDLEAFYPRAEIYHAPKK